MIYFQDDTYCIRPMKPQDPDHLAEGFLQQGWHKERELFCSYLDMQEKGARMVFVAETEGHAVGYTTLVSLAEAGPFRGQYPEIVDFNVLIPFQRRGIGGRILDAAENAARQFGGTVTLGVGLHNGYGSAQRMYVKRGYIPDGSGVWYQDKPLAQYAPCVNDDDLVLYFSKTL